MAICLIGRKKLGLFVGDMPDRQTKVVFTLWRYGQKKLGLLDVDMPDRQKEIVFTRWRYV